MRGAHCGLLWLFALGACNAILDIHEHDLAHGAAGSGSGTTGGSAGKPSTGGATGSPTSGGSAGTGGSDMPGGDGGVPRGGTAGTGGGGGTSSPGLAGEGGEQSGGTSSSGLAGEGGEQSGGRGDGACPNGFTGPDCAENIDDCASQPCGAKPNSHCVDGVATYTCVCDSGFTGSTCAPRLELLTPGFGLSLALAITPDGTVIVGNVQDTAQSSSHPFRWTEETGAVTLMSNSEPVDWGFATSVSTDGSVVGGYASTASGVGAYRWTQSTGIVKVGPGDQGFMNGNGSTLVGRDTTPSDGTHLWRWTSGTGVVDLGLFGSFARLEGLSSDGTAIIGSTDAGGFIWTSGDGIRTLGPSGVGMPGAVSADGRITVGVYTSNATAMAFVWKRPQDFADLDVGALTSTAATGLSSDGSVIVGTSAQDGWIWTSSTGARLLTDLLTAKGVDVSGYDSFQLKAVSDDGTIIVGSVTVLDSGVGSQAFIARLGD